jgi:pimeloyl-ACP methyl ester carboxylesterase
MGTYVSGLSSGGVLSAWLSAYARPGQVRAAVYEDPPLFASELMTSTGQPIRQSIGPMFALFAKYLGPQWTIGDWDGLVAASGTELPGWISMFFKPSADGPGQTIKEYDPEWGQAFWTGTVAASCDHACMLASVKTPVLLTHHFHVVDEATGTLMGALSDLQAQRAIALVKQAGQPIEYRTFPTTGHSMHGQDAGLFAATVTEWIVGLADEAGHCERQDLRRGWDGGSGR